MAIKLSAVIVFFFLFTFGRTNMAMSLKNKRSVFRLSPSKNDYARCGILRRNPNLISFPYAPTTGIQMSILTKNHPLRSHDNDEKRRQAHCQSASENSIRLLKKTINCPTPTFQKITMRIAFLYPRYQ